MDGWHGSKTVFIVDKMIRNVWKTKAAGDEAGCSSSRYNGCFNGGWMASASSSSAFWLTIFDEDTGGECSDEGTRDPFRGRKVRAIASRNSTNENSSLTQLDWVWISLAAYPVIRPLFRRISNRKRRALESRDWPNV
jgi:hypothetical protein